MARGRLITLEGGDGVGKTTQRARIAEALAQAGLSVVTTREPGGTDGAEAIRSLLLNAAEGAWTPATEALLHFAARTDHVARLIEPSLAQGTWVICDRFTDSTMVYQGYARDLGRPAVEAIEQAALGGFRPDLTLILDLPVEEGLRRRRHRGEEADYYERRDAQFQHRLRAGFLDIARREPARCAVVDAAQPDHAVTRDIVGIIQDRLGPL